MIHVNYYFAHLRPYLFHSQPSFAYRFAAVYLHFLDSAVPRFKKAGNVVIFELADSCTFRFIPIRRQSDCIDDLEIPMGKWHDLCYSC